MRHNYRTLIKEPTSRLLNHEKKHRHNIIGSRIRMLRLLKQGEAKSVREASKLIGYSWRHAQKWLTEPYWVSWRLCSHAASLGMACA